MIFSSKKITNTIKKNIEITLLFFFLFITITSTIFYNNKKNLVNKNYKAIIHNIYFQNSVSQVLDNLLPRYKNINHKISEGETFDKILSNYSIPNDEIYEIKKNLLSDYNLNNLKTNLNINLVIDQSENKRVTSLILPISITKKIQLIRNLDTNLFEKKIIIKNLNKKIIFKEGKILQSLYKTAVDLNIQPNIIIDFARIYGFQVDFQRDY